MQSQTDVARLEELGYELWRAPVVEELDGWRLRFAHGLTGRANAVWPNADLGTLPLDEKIARAERFYRDRDFPPRFQLTDAARPAGLAAALDARGYQPRGEPVAVEIAEALPRAVAHDEVEVDERLDNALLELFLDARRFSNRDVARTLLTGSPGRITFARIGDVAIGRGVALDGWLGVTSMWTAPAARRRGCARAILDTLLAWAGRLGCERALLQVESTNRGARALYEQVGFRPSHEYRYVLAPE